MKKISLLPLVAALAVAGTAQAQTAPTVSIYGQLDALFTSWTDDNDPIFLDEGARSRIGFRGEDKLNNGWTAFFQLEERFRLDDALPDNTFVSTTRRWGNRAQLGLKTPSGDVSFGYIPTALDYIYGGAKMGGNDTIGDMNGRRAQADDRVSNAINYVSPKFGPVTVYASYGFVEGAESATNAVPHQGLAFNISLGSAYVDVGYSQDRDLWDNYHLNGGIKLSDSLEVVAGATTSQKFATPVFGNINAESTRFGVAVKFKAAGGEGSVVASLAEDTNANNVEAEDFTEVGAQFSYPLSSRMQWVMAVSHEMQDGGFAGGAEDSRTGVQSGLRLKF